MKVIESYDGKRRDTNDLYFNVNSILMSDQDFFLKFYLTNRKSIKNYPIYVHEVFS